MVFFFVILSSLRNFCFLFSHASDHGPWFAVDAKRLMVFILVSTVFVAQNIISHSEPQPRLTREFHIMFSSCVNKHIAIMTLNKNILDLD